MKIKKGDTRSDGGNTKPGEVFQAQKGAMNKQTQPLLRNGICLELFNNRPRGPEQPKETYNPKKTPNASLKPNDGASSTRRKNGPRERQIPGQIFHNQCQLL
jgi:hypothetical protein